jgi:copper(I)-binding protein
MRNVVVQYSDPAGYPAGASAPLVVRIFNGGQAAIQLTRVEAPGAAGSVTLTSGSPTATPAPSPTSAEPTTTASPSPSGSTTPTPSASETPPPTNAPVVTPGGQLPITIPAQTWAMLVPGQGPYFLLNGLTNALAPGDTVGVNFRFSDGTVATLQVPVDLPTGAANRGSAQPSIGEPQG